MPKKGIQVCKEIYAELLKFEEKKVSEDEIERIVGIVAGIDERTIRKYIDWLIQLNFIMLAKDSDKKIIRNQEGYLIYQISDYILW